MKGTPRKGDAITVLDPIDVQCEFCGGAVTVGDVDGREAIMHSVPTCERFDQLAPIEFLRAMNQRLRERGCGSAG